MPFYNSFKGMIYFFFGWILKVKRRISTTMSINLGFIEKFVPTIVICYFLEIYVLQYSIRRKMDILMIITINFI